jgi:hypothetical protein
MKSEFDGGSKQDTGKGSIYDPNWLIYRSSAINSNAFLYSRRKYFSERKAS